MLYDIFDTSRNLLGTFKTDQNMTQSLYNILSQIFENDCLVILEHNETGFKHTYYVYTFNNEQFDDIKSLGTFSTNMTMHDAFDYVVQIFEPNNIFLRKEKIVCM